MKQFAVTIKDDKAKIFLNILKELSFIEDVKDISGEYVSESQKKIIKDRIEKYGDKSENYLDWEEIDKDLNID